MPKARKPQEILAGIPVEELFTSVGPIMRGDEEMDLYGLREALRGPLYEVLPSGAPPVRFAELWCAVMGIEVNRALLEWVVLQLLNEYEPPEGGLMFAEPLP